MEDPRTVAQKVMRCVEEEEEEKPSWTASVSETIYKDC